ncbi:Tar ligand binding domain homologue, partial [Oryzisolibacter propanilivorax]
MMNFQNLSVVRKLWGLVLGLMLVMLVLLATMVTHVQKLGSESQRIALANEERLGLALRWQGLTALAVERAVLGVSLADEAVAERLRGQAQHNIQTINGLQKQIEDKAFSAEDKAQLARVIEARKVVLEGIGQAGRMRAENDFAGVLTLVEQQLNPAVERYVAQQDAFAQLQQRQRDETVQLMAAQQLRAEWLGGAIALAVALAGILLSALLVRSITRPLARAVALADAIAAGDLTQ